MKANKKSVLIGALSFMTEVDPTNEIWDEAMERVYHFEIVENDDIAETIKLMRKWRSKQQGISIKDEAIVIYWIERLKIITNNMK